MARPARNGLKTRLTLAEHPLRYGYVSPEVQIRGVPAVLSFRTNIQGSPDTNLPVLTPPVLRFWPVLTKFTGFEGNGQNPAVMLLEPAGSVPKSTVLPSRGQKSERFGKTSFRDKYTRVSGPENTGFDVPGPENHRFWHREVKTRFNHPWGDTEIPVFHVKTAKIPKESQTFLDK